MYLIAVLQQGGLQIKWKLPNAFQALFVVYDPAKQKLLDFDLVKALCIWFLPLYLIHGQTKGQRKSRRGEELYN